MTSVGHIVHSIEMVHPTWYNPVSCVFICLQNSRGRLLKLDLMSAMAFTYMGCKSSLHFYVTVGQRSAAATHNHGCVCAHTDMYCQRVSCVGGWHVCSFGPGVGVHL